MEGDQEKKPEPKFVFVDDNKLADLIHTMLEAADLHVEVPVIKLIMEYQTNNYESLGIIKIKYK